MKPKKTLTKMDLFKTLGEILRPENLNTDFKEDAKDMKKIDINCIKCEVQTESICESCLLITCRDCDIFKKDVEDNQKSIFESLKPEK